jgi:hypothetical protein
MKKYLEFIKESVVEKNIAIYSEDDLHLIKEGVEIIHANNASLTYLSKLPGSLKDLNCWNNKLESLPELPENLVKIFCYINKLKSFPKLPENLEYLYCSDNRLEYLPKLPGSLTYLNCSSNELQTLPELPEGLTHLSCNTNKLKSLPELPEDLTHLSCYHNPLEYPIPHKFYNRQNNEWLEELNIKLSSYEHQKKLIEENGIYIMKKFEKHPELINDKIKEENPTYFLSVEYGF